MQILDLIKKSIDLGVDAINVSREKVEKLIDELVERGEIPAEEKPQAVKEVWQKVQQQEKEMVTKIRDEFKNAIQEIGLATKEDMKELDKHLAGLSNNLPKEENDKNKASAE